LLTTAASKAWENSRPIADPICAISEACKLAGTAPVGTAEVVFSASFALPASSTAFVISSTNSGMPSVRSTMSFRMLAGRTLMGILEDHQ
jgi:hypothetical protein